jgi:hypothetical protein
MTMDRIKFCALAAAVAATFTGEAFAQASSSTGSPAGTSSPASAGSRAPASTQATGQGKVAVPPPASAITGGVPAMGGVTPNRAELASSAFTKLDAASRGYLTIEDVRQLNGFESAFRQADRDGDGRLNASEFNAAWGAFTGNTR